MFERIDIVLDKEVEQGVMEFQLTLFASYVQVAKNLDVQNSLFSRQGAFSYTQLEIS